MTNKYYNSLVKEIEENFNGLTLSQINKLINYYFKFLGGDDGCEECYENYLCNECYEDLKDYAFKNFRLK